MQNPAGITSQPSTRSVEYRKYKATFHGTPAGASQQPASAHPALPGVLPRRTGPPEAPQPCRQPARRPALQAQTGWGPGDDQPAWRGRRGLPNAMSAA